MPGRQGIRFYCVIKDKICSIMFSWLRKLRRQHHKRNASRHIWSGWRKPWGMLTAYEPLRNYCTGLLLDGERKSVEPMAARLAPDHVQRMHESLHHFVAQSPWSDADMLRQVRELRPAGDAEDRDR